MCMQSVTLTLTFFRPFQKVTKNLYFFKLIPWMGATLWGPDLGNCLPFILDNGLYTQLKCRTCASNLLFLP